MTGMECPKGHLFRFSDVDSFHDHLDEHNGNAFCPACKKLFDPYEGAFVGEKVNESDVTGGDQMRVDFGGDP